MVTIDCDHRPPLKPAGMAKPPEKIDADQSFDPDRSFDEAWYIRNYDDIAEAVATGRHDSGWAHYVGHGRAEGRQPFDPRIVTLLEQANEKLAGTLFAWDDFLVADQGALLLGWLDDRSDALARLVLQPYFGLATDLLPRLGRYRRDDIAGMLGVALDAFDFGLWIALDAVAPGLPPIGAMLAIGFESGRQAAFHLPARQVAPEDLRGRLLAAVEWERNRPTPPDELRRIVGPVARALNAAVLRRSVSSSPIRFGDAAAKPALSVVVALTGWQQPALRQAAFFADTTGGERAEFIYVAAGRGPAADFEASIEAAHVLYGLDAVALRCSGMPGLPRARNAGASAARGDHLLFLSPHCMPAAADWLDRALEAAAVLAGRGVIGPCLLDEDDAIAACGLSLRRDQLEGGVFRAEPALLGLPAGFRPGAPQEADAIGAEAMLVPGGFFPRTRGLRRGIHPGGVGGSGFLPARARRGWAGAGRSAPRVSHSAVGNHAARSRRRRGRAAQSRPLRRALGRPARRRLSAACQGASEGSLPVPQIRVLSIASHHPDLLLGEAQEAAYALFRRMRAEPDLAPVFIGGVQHYLQPQLVKPAAAIWSYAGRADEFLLAVRGFDEFWQSNTGQHRSGWEPVIAMLRALRPDVVLFNHLADLGAELIRAVRTALPAARILFTLRDLALIAPAASANAGSRSARELPPTSAQGALGFPDRAPSELALRTRWLHAHLAGVDHFVATSEFLRDQYCAWGLAAGRVSVIRPGLRGSPPVPAPPTAARDRFGLFGPQSEENGLAVALDAAQALVAAGIAGFELRIGGSLRRTSPALRKRAEELAGVLPQLRLAAGDRAAADEDGAFARIGEVDWVIVPTLLRESAPAVVEAAFLAGRPVLCSALGGLPERVVDEVSGLHFPAGDGHALADRIAACLADPELWDRLSDGIPAVPDAAHELAAYRALWSGLAPDAPIKVGSSDASKGRPKAQRQAPFRPRTGAINR